MSKLFLKTWPFTLQEVVTLYWIQSPFRDKRGRWKVNVIFQNSEGELRPAEYPWGTLPHFRMGHLYQGGKLIGNSTRTERSTIYISDVSKGQIVEAVTAIPKWTYPLRTRANLTEKCIVYQSGSRKIVIPCMEILRSLLTPTRFLADALLYPQGLENLIDEQYVKEDGSLYLHLNNRIPSDLVSEGTVKHLSWLLHNNIARGIWESIYETIFKTESEPSSQESIKLSTLFPITGSTKLIARVLKDKDTWLVLEIMNISGIQTPYSIIEFTHDSLVKADRRPSAGSRSSRDSKDPVDTYELDNTDTPPNTDYDPIIIDTVPAVLSFDKPIEVTEKKLRSRVQRYNAGDGEEFDGRRSCMQPLEDNKKEEDNLVSTYDSEDGGALKAAEFSPIYVDSAGYSDGLSNFMKVICQLIDLLRNADISYEIKYLPEIEGKSFYLQKDGSIRKCVLVKVKRPGFKTRYILEVGRPDIKYLSTLVFWSRDLDFSGDQLGRFLSVLLRSLVINNGSWNEDFIKRNNYAKINMMRHVKNETPFEWADRIAIKVCAE